MKKHLLLLLGILLSLPAAARDFDYTYEGQTITYTVLDEDAKTVETKSGDWNNPGNKVSGNLILPSVVLDGETEYTLTEIGHSAFFKCSGLISVEIPYSVTKIGDHAFSECSGLTSVVIPNSVTKIGSSAFSYCSSLTGELIIPNSVETIDYGAFSSCSGLTSVTIPNYVTSIGQSAFSYCSSLESIDVKEGNKNFCSVDGVLFNSDKTFLIQCPGGKTGQYNIPNSVIYIDVNAFSVCSGLTSVVIPNSVTYIGDNAFSGCSGLTSVDIPNSVTTIGNYAFYGCSGLTSVTIPNSVTYIGNSAFSGCSGLTSVVIPNSVTSIRDSAFSWCSGLTSVTIPNSVTSIGDYAFYGCSCLTSVTIPTSVTSIGKYAFRSCRGLTSVYYGADKPIKGSSNIFSESTYKNANLYTTELGVIMAGTVDPWKNFQNIEVYDFAGINEIVADKVAAGDIDYDAPYEVYNLNGVKVGNSTDNLAPGIYIIRQGNKVKKLKIQNS